MKIDKVALNVLRTAHELDKEGQKEYTGFQIAHRIEQKRKRLIGFGTIYRALYRMEQKGILVSRWEETSEKRPRRRYYRLPSLL